MKEQWQTLKCEVDSKILTLTLNRPEQLNAFTVTMCEELEQVFTDINRDDSIAAVIVTGAGRAFCAGMDLSVEGNVFGLDETQRPQTPADYRMVRDTGGRVALKICACTKPVIAAVNGVAVGIGATMLLPMDFRICTQKSRFGFVFSRLGIVNEACSSFFLPRVVGLPKAMEWLLKGNIFDAEEARTAGLVSEVTAAEQLLARAREIAREIIDNTSPVSLALIRQMVYSQLASGSPLSAHQLESLGVFYTSLADGHEGVEAFRAKRTPQYRGSAKDDLPPHFPWWDPDGESRD